MGLSDGRPNERPFMLGFWVLNGSSLLDLAFSEGARANIAFVFTATGAVYDSAMRGEKRGMRARVYKATA